MTDLIRPTRMNSRFTLSSQTSLTEIARKEELSAAYCIPHACNYALFCKEIALKTYKRHVAHHL